ncbi:hypothetical protein ACOSQ4_015983 [Xanthoceras sorbifolium]
MEGVFVFAAKPTPASSEKLKKKPPATLSRSKRCRVDDGDRDEVVELRKSVGESFKSKLMGVANPASWAGFSLKKEKLKLEEGGVFVTLDSNGMLINLLKDSEDLCKEGMVIDHDDMTESKAVVFYLLCKMRLMALG